MLPAMARRLAAMISGAADNDAVLRQLDDMDAVRAALDEALAA